MVTVLAVTSVSILVFVSVFLYCFKDRRISDRPGAFYLLVAAIVCEALLLSNVMLIGAREFRDRLEEDFSGTGGLAGVSGGDPSGSKLIVGQLPRIQKPQSSANAEWRLWQSQLRQFLVNDVYEMGSSPSTSPDPELLLERQTEDGMLIRRQYSIPAVDGDSITAILLTPADGAVARPLPGILMIPGHVKPGMSGLAQMVLPVKSYQQSAARELALAGFATLTIELRGFGMRGPPEFPDHRIVAFNAILAGSFYKKLAISDIKRALDLLESLPEVDADRLGISGVSLGAELSVEYAAMDARIKAISFHSHGGSTGPYAGIRAADADQPHYCHVIPAVNGVMQKEDPFLLLAPRPTQGLRGGNEPFVHSDFLDALSGVWTAMGAGSDLELASVPGRGHEYFVQPAVRFFQAHL